MDLKLYIKCTQFTPKVTLLRSLLPHIKVFVLYLHKPLNLFKTICSSGYINSLFIFMVECKCSLCLRMYTNICKVSDVYQSNAQPSSCMSLFSAKLLVCTTAPAYPEVVSGRGEGVSGEPCALRGKRDRRDEHQCLWAQSS